MANRVVMPKLTDTMEEGVLRKWYKKEGEFIESGDPIAEVETDKAVMDLEAFASGILKKIFVPEGITVSAGHLIAIIAREDEDIDAMLVQETPKVTEKPEREKEAVGEKMERPVGEGSSFRISPLAKKMAEEHRIDTATLKGSGPAGRITQKDIEKVIAAGEGESVSTSLPHPTEAVRSLPPSGSALLPLSMMRKTIAKRIVESKAPVPHFYVVSEIDMEKALEFKSQMGQNGVRLKMTEIFLKAAALTLRKFPAYRSSYFGDFIRISERINVGFAVGIEDGVITPVICDCDQKSLPMISEEARDKIKRAADKGLAPWEYTGAIFSISNLGMYDVESFSAIITPPESGVLAIGSILEKPVVRDQTITIGKTIKVTLATDHRVADGLLAAQFLLEFKRILQNPEQLTTD